MRRRVSLSLPSQDALALTNPTAEGQYPVDTVSTMLAIAHEAEQMVDYRAEYIRQRSNWFAQESAVTDTTTRLVHSLASSAVKTAWDVAASVIVVFTLSGRAATIVSAYRPHCAIVAVTSSTRTARQLAIVHGVRPMLVGSLSNTDAIFDHVIRRLREQKLVGRGETVVHTSGALEAEFGEHVVSVHVCE